MSTEGVHMMQQDVEPVGFHSRTPIHRPAFREQYCVQSISGEGSFLVSENATFLLEGPLLEAVIPLVNGISTTEDIASILSERLSPTDVYAAIEFLAQQGHIRESDQLMPPQIAAFWDELSVDTREVPLILQNAPIKLISLSAESHESFVSIASTVGLQFSTSAPFSLVLVDDYLDPRLEEINLSHLQTATPWLPCKPDGLSIWLGPFIRPHSGPCWECLASRLRDNREVEAYINRKTGRSQPMPTTRARLWTSRQIAYAMTATQIARWLITGSQPSLQSSVLTADTVSLSFSYHAVIRRPQCPACGNPSLSQYDGSPLPFRSSPSHFITDGGERHEPADITFAKLSHHISPISGIIRQLTPSPWHALSPIRTYSAGHNFALKNRNLPFIRDHMRMSSSGKGRTDAQAKTSALCEALERYSGIFVGDEKRIRATYRQLGAEAIHPNASMQFSDRQYAERELWRRRGSRFQIVPDPFDEFAEIEWSPVHSYTHNQRKYLPTSYLYYGYPVSDDEFYCWADSNGCAAGTTIEDACLQGLYELIERDAVCIWWYNQIRRPRVKLETCRDPYVDELQRFYASINREFWVIDLTTDIPIPVYAAISRRIAGPTEDIVMGFGAHRDPRIALSRALTEMNQFMPAVLNVASDGTTFYGMQDRDALTWWQLATTLNQPYLTPLTAPSDRHLDEAASPDEGALDQRLGACLAEIERLGMEVLFLDQTRPDIGLKVVKVIVPGLRHFWARFASGRLYDVPVKLGWLKHPTAEEELNPIPMFL